MGRPERELDRQAGTVAQFAAQLRALRDRAGRPKYATMAQRTDRSQTTLSEAAGGRRFPTWETVAAFVQGCGEDPAAWRERWQRAADALATGADDLPSPDADERSGQPSSQQWPGPAHDTEPATLVTDDPSDAANAAVPAARRWRPRVLAAGIGALLTLGVLAAVRPALPDSTPSNPPATPAGETLADSGSQPPDVRDEADPKDAGCATDPGLSTLDHVEISNDHRPIGRVELRYAPSCGAAWPRFVPYNAAVLPLDVTIQVDAYRAADDRRAPFTMRFTGTDVFGNLLRSTRHCVRAEVVIVMPAHSNGDLRGRTGCYRGRTYEPTAAP